MLLCDMNPNLRFAQNIVFVPVGRQVCPGDNRIFYVTSGVGTLAVHGSSYPLAPGTFALINSGGALPAPARRTAEHDRLQLRLQL